MSEIDRSSSGASQREAEQRAYRKQMRENDALIIGRFMGRLQELGPREREVTVAGASFMEEAKTLREALEVASDLLEQEGYATDPDYTQEWKTIKDALDAN